MINKSYMNIFLMFASTTLLTFIVIMIIEIFF